MDERTDLLAALAHARHFLRNTTNGMTDDQARQRSTVSGLTLGGLIKHVAEVERSWTDFILADPLAVSGGKNWTEWDESDWAERERQFQLLPEETLAGVLADYERVAVRTDELVRTLPDLGVSRPLPEAPWFEPGSRWSARLVLMHMISETSQHAGHADIIRESIDGAKSMG